MCAGQRSARTWLVLADLALGAQKIPIQHILNQGRFSRTGNASNAGENTKRNFDVDVFQVVLGRAGDLDAG